MDLSVWIKGINKTALLKTGSLTINRGRTIATIARSLVTTAGAIGADDGSYIGQDLQIKDGSTVLFGGVIKTLNFKKIRARNRGRCKNKHRHLLERVQRHSREKNNH